MTKLFILREGWCVSYKLTSDGGRQIVRIHIPGDFVGLLPALYGSSAYSSQAVTDIVVSAIAMDGFWHSKDSLRLLRVLLLAAARNESILMEHLTGIGRRNAVVRTAHLLLELGFRLRRVGLARDNSYECPLSQCLLADALGLSPIHLNRVLRELREKNLVAFQNGIVKFLELDSLICLADFDSAYLHDLPPVEKADTPPGYRLPRPPRAGIALSNA